MPLVVERRPKTSALAVRPLPTLAAVCGGVVAFVVVVAFVARATADGATLPAPPDAGVVVVDAGFVDAGFEDAGFADAGVVVGVSLDAGVVDSGPADVEGPPVDARDVAAAAVVVVERCAGEALRWDPSLGGAFALVVELPVGAPVSIAALGLDSPVLTSCLARRAADAAWPESVRALAVAEPLAVRARAALDAAGKVTWSEAAVTSSTRVENVNDGAQPE